MILWKINFILYVESISCKGVIDGNRCIRLLKSTYDPVDYAKSADLCSFYGGRHADITTPELYNKVYEHVRNEWNIYKSSDRNYVHVRIGTKFMVSIIISIAAR